MKRTPNLHWQESVIKSHFPTDQGKIWYSMWEGVSEANCPLSNLRSFMRPHLITPILNILSIAICDRHYFPLKFQTLMWGHCQTAKAILKLQWQILKLTCTLPDSLKKRHSWEGEEQLGSCKQRAEGFPGQSSWKWCPADVLLGKQEPC